MKNKPKIYSIEEIAFALKDKPASAVAREANISRQTVAKLKAGARNIYQYHMGIIIKISDYIDSRIFKKEV